MKLIDADNLLKLLNEEKNREDCFGIWYQTVCSMIRLLEAAPEVPVVEVVKRTGSADPKDTDCAWK